MGKKVVGAALVLVIYNFLFLSSSQGHVKVGLVFLAAEVILWLPEILRKLHLESR